MVAEKISEDWTRFGKKQILSIGKKRPWVHDEDDEFDNAQAQGEGGNSSSDDEEGRTSAVKEKRKKARVPSAHSNDAEINDEGGLESEPPKKKKKKKKKKGSKERERESFVDANDGSATKVPADTQNAKEGVRGEGVSNNKGNDGDRTDKRDSNIKRKRKKVRSRQKNIRKDTRSVNAKPSHLVLGRSDYAGRQLTEETRKRLGLETMNDSVASKFDETFDNGEWVGGDKGARTSDGPKEDMDENSAQRTTGKTDDDGENNLTKIGDCFVDAKPNESNESDLGKSMSMFPGKREKNKKKKQRKFKNLATG
ncbi:hypothetical protein ACHAWF_007045 [Thalassiosira exigua]